MTTSYRSTQIQPAPPPGVDGQTAALRKRILGQWQTETLHRLANYPLPVPFCEMPFGQLDGREIATMQDWSVILRGKRNIEPPNLNDTFENIAETFKHPNMPRRLVVLGDAGSGKTVTAQALTVLLLGGTIVGETHESAAAGDTSGEMLVPVLLQLSKWDPKVSLEQWAETQMLREITGVGDIVDGDRKGERITRARRLIEDKQVLMVLDGLDEVKEANRAEAFRKLALAAEGDRPMVITCRTQAFVKMVADASMPLPKTPVIRLEPLDLGDVIDYLSSADETRQNRFAPLTARLEAQPYGELAKALSSPFRLWLVSVVYRSEARNPAELLNQHTVSDMERILLSGLVEAAFAAKVPGYPRLRDQAEIDTAHRRLTKIAQYLGPKTERQDIDWWVLPNRPPRWYIGGVIGAIVGLLLGAASGYAAAVRFSPRIGEILGLSMLLATGLLAGVTACRPQEYPRTVDLKFDFRGSYRRILGCLGVGVAVAVTAGYADAVRGGWVAAVATAVIVGPAAAGPCMAVFGKVQGATAGITAALALGLASGLSVGNHHAVLSGVIAGVAFVPSAWVFVGIFQPSRENYHINPDSLLDRDRRGSQVVAVTAGFAFAVIYGVALGPLVGAIAFVGLTVAVVLTVSMWGAFNVSRVWFAAEGMFPMTLMAFLREAYDRGVLRRAGGTYQFRHTKLKYALLDMAAEDPVPIAVDHFASNTDLD